MRRKAWIAVWFVLDRFPVTIGMITGGLIIYTVAKTLDWFLPQSFID